MKQMRVHKFNVISKSVTHTIVPWPVAWHLAADVTHHAVARLAATFTHRAERQVCARSERLPNEGTALLCGRGCIDDALRVLVDVFACNALHTQAGSDESSHA